MGNVKPASNAEQLRESAEFVHLVTDKPVAESLSTLLRTAADLVERYEDALRNIERAQGMSHEELVHWMKSIAIDALSAERRETEEYY